MKKEEKFKLQLRYKRFFEVILQEKCFSNISKNKSKDCIKYKYLTELENLQAVNLVILIDFKQRSMR